MLAGRLAEQLSPTVAKHNPPQKSLLRKNRLAAALAENSLTSPEVQQVIVLIKNLKITEKI